MFCFLKISNFRFSLMSLVLNHDYLNITNLLPVDIRYHQMAVIENFTKFMPISLLAITHLFSKWTSIIKSWQNILLWGWIGHMFPKPAPKVTRQALDWNPQGQRKIDQQKETWHRSIDIEAQTAGKTWAELMKLSQNLSD